MPSHPGHAEGPDVPGAGATPAAGEATGGPGGADPAGWASGRLLSTAARLVEHAWDAHLARWGLNHTSFAVLWMVEAEPTSQRELARRMQVQEQTMSRVVAGLERAGYVTRARSGTDRRQRLVTATDSGRTARRAAEDGDVAERLLSDALGADDLAALRRLLTVLVQRTGESRWA